MPDQTRRVAVLIFALALLGALAGLVSAQDNWGRYSWGTLDREGFTVLLPTIPEQLRGDGGEQGILGLKGTVVYSVSFRDGASREEFDRRVAEWSISGGDGAGGGIGTGGYNVQRARTKEISVCGHTGLELVKSDSVQHVFLIDGRIYQVAVTGASNSHPDVARFLGSFSLINPWRNWKGIRTNEPFEDPPSDSVPANRFESYVCKNIGRIGVKEWETKLPSNSPLRMLLRPPAKYPEAAKKSGIQGTVSLRVTFLGNGSIGPITVLKGLNREMDQSAINAAKLIKFQPERKAGKFITVTKTIEYSFAIY